MKFKSQWYGNKESLFIYIIFIQFGQFCGLEGYTKQDEMEKLQVFCMIDYTN